MTDLVIRPLAAGEESVFESLNDPGLVGFAASGERYSDRASLGQYRPEWTWVALRDGIVVARAAWWAGPQDTTPRALDWLDFTDPNAAVQLLRTAPLRAGYELRLPPGWRDSPAVRQAAEDRISVAQLAGLTLLVERYRYQWTPQCRLPERPGRLEFRPEPDDRVIVEVFRRAHHGTLDAHARRAIAESGLEAAAQAEVATLRWMPSPRSWWRVAYVPGGDLVGLAAPCRNYSDPIIGYIAVVPEQRGRGYAYDLLAEATHLLAGEGGDRIVAGTDVTNIPMVRAFARAGYPVIQHRLDFSA